MYLGTLEKDPRVDVLQATDVFVEPQQPLPVELDGELPGRTPVRFEVLPGLLRVIVPSA
jgi:diacylglycerol kinase family enzyme